jgi:CheY-like chemotaxis protein
MLVALTGYSTPEARERSRAAGFDRHLIKPIDPDVLRDLMVEKLPPRPQPSGTAPRLTRRSQNKDCRLAIPLVECAASWCGVEQSGSSSGS